VDGQAQGLSLLWPGIACARAQPLHICPGYDKVPPDCSERGLHVDGHAQGLSPLWPRIACIRAQPLHICPGYDKVPPDCSERGLCGWSDPRAFSLIINERVKGSSAALYAPDS